MKKPKDYIMTKKELLKILKSIPVKDKDQRNRLVCSLIGHSRISTTCFGYRNCARCGDQLGDSLVSVDFGGEKAVIVGHNCSTCKKNYKECTWKDKIYCPDPFKIK